MKIRAINPGTTYQRGDGWRYNYRRQTQNGWDAVQSKEAYSTQKAAHAAMRSEVYRLRRRHGLETDQLMIQHDEQEHAAQAANDL